MKKVLSLALAGIMTASIFAGCGQKAVDQSPDASQAPKAWEPTKEITMIVPSSAGGGSDLNGRTIADIALKNNYSPKSFMVTNTPGGSGAVAFTNLFAGKGDPHSIMVLHSGQVMGSYVNNWDVKAENLTYLGVVAFDDLTLCVTKDGKYSDLDSLLKAVKENPEGVKIAGSQRGNSDHLSFEMLNKYTDSKFAYVSFNGSGDAMSNLLGGHVDAGIFNPTECLGQIEAGKVIPVATFAKERLGGAFKDTKTFIEMGYKDLTLNEVRAFAGPPNMPAEAVKFYEDLFKKVTDNQEWKENYIQKNLLTDTYMNAEDTKKFFEEQIEIYKTVFKEVGVIK